MVKMMSNKDDIIVSDLMLDLEEFPITNQKTFLKEAIDLMENSKLGVVCIVDAKKKFVGMSIKSVIFIIFQICQKY